jgi:hypothetical protein
LGRLADRALGVIWSANLAFARKAADLPRENVIGGVASARRRWLASLKNCGG